MKDMTKMKVKSFRLRRRVLSSFLEYFKSRKKKVSEEAEKDK